MSISCGKIWYQCICPCALGHHWNCPLLGHLCFTNTSCFQVNIDTKKIQSIWNLFWQFNNNSKRKLNFSGIMELSNIFLISIVCLIHTWRHFLRNSACAKKSIARWSDNDGSIEHRVIVPSPSYCRVIASSTQTRWCNGVFLFLFFVNVNPD